MKHDLTDTPSHVWQEYRSGLYRFVLKRVNDEAVADDIVQDALSKVIANLGSLRDQQKIRQWMYQITRNAIIDYYRRNQAVTELPDELSAVEEEDGTAIQRELSQCCIAPFIERLPQTYREAIVLSEIEGLTQREVANRQGLSLSGAKSRVQRGRKMLKEMMVACCHFELDNAGRIIDYESANQCSSC